LELGNTRDSLAEAYMDHGDKALAMQSYRKSLELNPKKIPTLWRNSSS